MLHALLLGLALGSRFTLRPLHSGGWTLVDPAGEDIFIVALNHLASPLYYAPDTGANGLEPCRFNDVLCQEADLFNSTYGGSWSAATADFIERTRSWGFNSAGYEYVPHPTIRWPYIPGLFLTNASHIFSHGDPPPPMVHGGFAQAGLFPDVFDPAWERSADARVAHFVKFDHHQQRSAPNRKRVLGDVVGYYFEDQPIWNVSAARRGAASKGGGPSDWAVAMRSLPGFAPGKIAWVEWVGAQYGVVENATAALEAACRTYGLPPSVRTWAAFAAWNFSAPNPAYDPLSPGVEGDDSKFIGVVADYYFKLAAAAVRRHDPDGLVFGQRFRTDDAPPVVLAAAARWFDVISFQPSTPATPAEADEIGERLALFSAQTGRPVFVADSAVHYVEEPFPDLEPAGCLPPGRPGTNGSKCCANEKAAGEVYTRLLAGVRRQAGIVGYAHCQYINRAVTREGDYTFTPILKQGLLKFDGTPHTELVAAVTAANRAATGQPESRLPPENPLPDWVFVAVGCTSCGVGALSVGVATLIVCYIKGMQRRLTVEGEGDEELPYHASTTPSSQDDSNISLTRSTLPSASSAELEC